MSVRFEKQEPIGHIVLDRPPANTYDRPFLDELDAAIEEARRDDGVKAIVVRSANERFFSAGADISVFAKGDLDAVYIVHAHFRSAISTPPGMPCRSSRAQSDPCRWSVSRRCWGHRRLHHAGGSGVGRPHA